MMFIYPVNEKEKDSAVGFEDVVILSSYQQNSLAFTHVS